MAAASGMAVGAGMSPRARQIVAASGLGGYRPRGERLRQKKICARTRTGTPFTVLAVTVAGNVLEKRSHLKAASKVRFGRAGDAAVAATHARPICWPTPGQRHQRVDFQSQYSKIDAPVGLG
jgi:hypothetical protein